MKHGSASKKAGLTIRFHDLRHTYSYLASSGKVDIYTLKELLGHSTMEKTNQVSACRLEKAIFK